MANEITKIELIVNANNPYEKDKNLPAHTVVESLMKMVSKINEMVDLLNGVPEDVVASRERLDQAQALMDETTNLLVGTKNKLDNKRDMDVKINNLDMDISSDALKLKLVNLADEVIQAISGDAPVNNVIADSSIVTEKIASNAVTPEKTSFLIKPSVTNLYNADSPINVTGYYITPTTGVLVTNSGWKYSHPIPIKIGETYSWFVDSGFFGGSAVRLPLYDEVGTYLGSGTGTITNNIVTYTIPASFPTAKFAKINIRTSKADQMFVIGYTYPSTFVPYNENDVFFSENLGLNSKMKTEVGKIGMPNPLYGKIISCNGDSIMFGAGSTGGFVSIIASRNNMTLENKAVSGATIANGTFFGDGVTPRHCISQTISTMRVDADYILLEGGINDYSETSTLGTVTSDYSSALDETTFCGAFESMLKQAILRFQGKKIGFIIPHRIKNYGSTWDTGHYKKMLEMCDKWGIPVCDLQKLVPSLNNISELRNTYTANADGWHPNEQGYLKFYCDKIEHFMMSL